MRERDDKNLNFLLLRCLVSLVDHAQVTRAADALDMGQPAMSRALAQLRRLTGDPILVKGHTGLTPSAKAIELRDAAAHLLRGVDSLLGKAAAFDPTASRRTFRVVVTDYAECVFLDPLIQRLTDAFPGISVDLHHPLPLNVLPLALERGEADFCLGMLPLSLDSLRHRLVFRDEICCLVARSHTVVGEGLSLSPAQLASLDHVLIRPTTRVFGEAVDEALSRVGLERNARMVTANYLSVPYIVESTHLAALVPLSLARRFAERFAVCIVDVDMDFPPYEVYLYWHERTHNHRDHRWFREQVFAGID